MKNLNLYLEKLIKIGLPLLYFLISLTFYLRTYDSCQIKITLIQIGGTVIILLFLIKLLYEWPSGFFKKNLYIILPLLLFLLSGIISYFRSPLKGASWMELIRRVIYIGIAILVIREFNSFEKFRRLFRWLFFAVLIATIYGVIQFLDKRFFPPGPTVPGLDFFIWRQAFGTRVFSTFGNPNFYGDFLVVMAPIVLAHLLRTKNLFYLFLYGLICFNVVVTYSKGAWVGFTSGFFFFCLISLYFFREFKSKKIRNIVKVVVLAVVVISALATAWFIKKRTDSVKFRVYTWLSCWEMIKTKPILGTGIGTFYVTYPAWRRPQIFFIEGKHNTETDHPENEYLEVWFDEGTIGIGIFLWIISLFIFLALKGLKKLTSDKYNDERAYILLGLLSGFLGMLTHNFVCVSLRFVSSGVFLWLLVGLIGAVIVNSPLPYSFSSPIKLKNSQVFIIWLIFWTYCFRNWTIPWGIVIPYFLPILIVGLFLETELIRGKERAILAKNKPINYTSPIKGLVSICLIIIAFQLYKKFRGYFMGDIYHNRAIFHSKRGEWDEALKYYTLVNKNNPSFIMAHYFMGNVFNDRWDTRRTFRKEWGDKVPMTDPERALKKYEDVKKLAPNYVQVHHQTGLVYLKLGRDAKARGDMEAARKYWEKAIYHFNKYNMIDPIFPDNYYRLAWIYFQLGEIEKAIQAYNDHLQTPLMFKKVKHHSLLPEDWGRRRHIDYKNTYIRLGDLYYLTNDYENSQRCYINALNITPNDKNIHERLKMVQQKIVAEKVISKELAEIKPTKFEIIKKGQ